MADAKATVDALNLDAECVQVAVAAQQVCRAGVEAMIAAGGKNLPDAVFMGAYAMVLAYAVKEAMSRFDTSAEAALVAIVTNAQISFEGGFGPWSSTELRPR